MFTQVEDFLKNDDFIRYALGESPESASRWELYWAGDPALKESAADAMMVMQQPPETVCGLSVEEKCRLKESILNTLDLIESIELKN